MAESDPLFTVLDHAVAEGEPAAVDALLRWSAQNSGSGNLVGLGAMAGMLEADLARFGGRIERVQLPPAPWVDDRGVARERPLGEALRVVMRPEAPRRVLLVGHMDTVFAHDHPFQVVSVDRDSGLLRGPGLADAKGGVVVAALALTAFEATEPAAHLGWELWITPDEELGSPGTAPLLWEAARRFVAGLVFEPAQPGGALVGARKGSGNYTLVVRGRSAHAGRNPEQGRNAVALAARAVGALQGWNGARPGLVVNVGVFHGGTARNVVPDLAVVGCNLRATRATDQRWVDGQLRELVAELDREQGFSAQLHGGCTRPPRPLDAAALALLEHLAALGRGMDLPVSWRDSGGVSDVNVLAAAGLPAVDGLGPVGGGLHTADEHISRASVARRARLCARLLVGLAREEVPLPTEGRGLRAQAGQERPRLETGERGAGDVSPVC